jgi:hypothetical protein
MTLALEIMLGVAALLFAVNFKVVVNNITYEMGK